MNIKNSLRIRLAAAALSMAGFLAAHPASAEESRSFAVGWLSLATNSTDDDCGPGGPNPGIQAQKKLIMRSMGYKGKELEEMIKKAEENPFQNPINEILSMRGRVNGQPANPYLYPATVKDENWKTVIGKYAYGFDLDGRGENTKNAFEDPDTHEKGVDNQLFRAIGCDLAFRGTLKGRPTHFDWAWHQVHESQPAWLITITGESLSKDGPVTVKFDRSYDHLRSNIDGSPRPDTTFRLDPDPRSRNQFKGELKNGVVTITEHHDFHMLQNPLVVLYFQLKRAHMRLKLNPDNTLEGFVGGYQPWGDFYHSIAASGSPLEFCNVGDIPGIYWQLRKNADGDPDAKTGLNSTISATYYMTAVPAFVVKVDQVTADAGK